LRCAIFGLLWCFHRTARDAHSSTGIEKFVNPEEQPLTQILR
jgi:hypothetical protein